MADTYFQNKRYSEAIPYYQHLIDEKDDTYLDDAWLRMGEIHYNSKDIPKARRAWEHLDRTFGRSVLGAEGMYGLALCDMHEQKYREARKVLHSLTSRYPGYADLAKVREMLGILRFNEKDFNAALEIFEGVDTPVAAFYRGMSYFQQKQFQEAAQAFNVLGRLSSNSYMEIGSYLKAECFRMVRNDPLSAKAYQEFATAFPASRLYPYAVLHLARALNELGQGDKAAGLLQRLREEQSSREVRTEALHLEVEIAARQGQHRKAKELVERALAGSGKGEAERFTNTYVLLGYYLLKVGQVPEAADVMMEMVKRVPGHALGVAAYAIAGQAAYRRQDWRQAISDFETALLKYEYGPLSDVSMAMMLSAYFSAKNYQELVTNANRVMGVVSADFSAEEVQWRSQSHLLVAEAYYHLKQYAEASRYFEMAMREPTLAAHSQLSLAWSRYHEGRCEDALRLARQYLGRPGVSADSRASAQFLIASSYFNVKNYDASIDAFQNFRKSFPKDGRVAESWLHEGWAYRQMGRHGDALQTWQRLVSLFPNSKLAQDAQVQVGRLYFQAHKYEESGKAFSEFLERWPQAPAAAEAQWLLAQGYYNSRHDDAAIKAYIVFLSRFPKDERREGAGTQLMQTRFRQASQGRNPSLLDAFVRLYPKSPLAPEAQYQLGQLYFEAQSWEGAIVAFRKLMLDYPGTSQAPMALIAIAHAQEKLKKHEAAVAEYRSMMELFPQNPLALDAAMRAGALYFNLAKYQEAANSFRFITERDCPNDVKANAMYNLGVTYKKMRSYPEAIETFERFTLAFKDEPRAVDCLIEIAALYRLMDQNEKAALVYQMLLKRRDIAEPVKMTVYNQLAEIFKAAGNKEKVMESYAGLIPLKPEGQDVRLVGLAQLAALYEEREQWDSALEVYGHIQRSGGQAEWVRSAEKRAKEIREYIEAQKAGPAKPAAEAAQNDAAPAAQPPAETKLEPVPAPKKAAKPKPAPRAKAEKKAATEAAKDGAASKAQDGTVQAAAQPAAESGGQPSTPVPAAKSDVSVETEP
jgi:TolA-binding protein